MSEEVSYKRAKPWQIALAPAANCVPTLFIILMTFASYVAVGVYGATTVLAGTIITGTRIFDGITDPIIGVFSDKLNSRFGRARPLMIIGYIICAIILLSMFKFGLGGGENRAWVFATLYIVYIIGYTIYGVGVGMVGPIMTNDPKQRPALGKWASAYIVILSSCFSMVLSMTLMPKHNYQMGLPLFADLAIIILVAAAIFVLITIIVVTLSGNDVPESYSGGKKEEVNFKDAWNIIRHNKAMQMYIVSVTSDKLAAQTSSNSVIGVMIFGILLGDYTFSGKLTFINMFVTLALLFFFVGRLAGNSGLKKALVQWTTYSLIVTSILWIFMIVVDTQAILSTSVLKYIFVILMVIKGAVGTACTSVTDPVRYDVLDYEMARSGKYMPAVVNTAYSFIDKLISSFSSTIVALILAMIGYTTVMPQATDAYSSQIFWVATFLAYGMPILGWICTLIAMKYYDLTKEKMEEVQAYNAKLRSGEVEFEPGKF